MPLTRPSLNQINTTITALNDPLTVLNKGGTTANQDVGFVFNRDGGSTSNVAIIWDETNDRFALGLTTANGAINSNVTISSYANLRADGITANSVQTDNFTVDESLTIGSQIIYAQGTNGFSVNEDYDPSNSSTQTAYHFTSGAGRETVAFTLARTAQFTDGFGIYGTAADNTFVYFGEQSNTKWEWRSGVGIQPLDLDGGTLLANLSAAGNFTVSGNITASGVTGNLIPSANLTYNLGSLTNQWHSLYVGPGSLYVNGQKVLQEDSGTIVFSADENQNISIQTAGSGDIEFNPGGSIELKGNVVLAAGKTLSQAGGAASEFSAGVKSDSVTSRTTNTNLTLSGNGTGVVNVNDSLTVANDVTVTGNLTVNGATTTVSSTNTVIEDALLLLADGQSGAPTKDAGFVVERGSSTNVAWLWDESADEFVAVTTSDDATTVGDVGITTYANVHASYFLGDGSQLTGLPETYGNTEVLAYLTDNSYATQTYVNTANTNMGGYVDNAVSTANVNLKGYTDGQLASYATTSALTTANTNVVGYVDSAVSTANVNLKGYSDATFETQSSATTANTNVVGYVDSAVSTANVNLKGYSDATFQTTSSATTANTNMGGYVDNAVSTANVNLKGYTDNEISTANVNLKGYTDGEITTVNSTITTANTNVVGYVDNAVSTANVNLKGYVDAGNTNVVGYVDSAVSTANVNLKGYTDGQLASYATTSDLTTANTNMQGYVDNEISSLIDSAPGTLDTLNEIAAALGDDPNLATTLTNTITTANTNMKGYVDGEITTVGSTVTTANTNVVGYVDNAVSTANVNLKGYVDAGNTNVVGYVDNAVTTANTNLKGYTDGQLASYATTSSLTTANTNMGGYVDNAVSTANVNLKGYADATFAQQTLTADLDGADTYGIINLIDPTSAQDAVTLSYLESALSSDVTNIISDDTSVTVTDDGVNPGYIELTVDNTVRGNVTSSGINVTGLSIAGTAVTATAAELNILDGVTANATELNLLDGVTATTAELNYVDGVTSAIQTQLNAKAPTAGPNFTGNVSIGSILELGDGQASASVGHTATMNEGIFWHSSNSNYAIYRTSGAWSGDYQQIKIDWPTGIILAPGSAYGKSYVDVQGKLTASGNVETTGGEVNVKARGEVRFFETDNGQFVALRAPNSVASNVTFNLPGADGTSGQVLQTDGAGTMSWVDQGGGGGGGGSGGFFTSTITTHPSVNGDEDLATGPSDDTLETPFDTGGTDEFGVSMGVVYDQMEPQGQYLTYDLGDEEAYVGA